MKRMWLIGLALLLTLLAGQACADQVWLDGGAADRVTLLAAPSADAEELGDYFTGVTVERTESRSGWSKIIIGAESGWVPDAQLSWTAVSPRMPAGMSITGSMGANWLNLRSAPDTGAEVIDRLWAGDAFLILGQTTSDWCYVRRAEGEGYAKADYIHSFEAVSAWSGYHFAPTGRIDVRYPQFDDPELAFVNELIAAKAASLTQSADWDTGELTMQLDCAVTLQTRRMLSIAFWGEAYLDGGAYPQNVLFTLNLDLASMKELAAADLFDLGNGFMAMFLAQAAYPGEPVTGYDEELFPGGLAQQQATAAEFGDAVWIPEGVRFYCKPAGVVFSVPAIHATGSDHFDGLLTYEQLNGWMDGSVRWWES